MLTVSPSTPWRSAIIRNTARSSWNNSQPPQAFKIMSRYFQIRIIDKRVVGTRPEVVNVKQECRAGLGSRGPAAMRQGIHCCNGIGDKGDGREKSAADNMSRSKVQTQIFRSVRWEIGEGRRQFEERRVCCVREKQRAVNQGTKKLKQIRKKKGKCGRKDATIRCI